MDEQYIYKAKRKEDTTEKNERDSRSVLELHIHITTVY